MWYKLTSRVPSVKWATCNESLCAEDVSTDGIDLKLRVKRRTKRSLKSPKATYKEVKMLLAWPETSRWRTPIPSALNLSAPSLRQPNHFPTSSETNSMRKRMFGPIYEVADSMQTSDGDNEHFCWSRFRAIWMNELHISDIEFIALLWTSCRFFVNFWVTCRLFSDWRAVAYPTMTATTLANYSSVGLHSSM